MAISPVVVQLTSEVYFVDDQEFLRGDQAVIAGSVIGGNDIFSGASNAQGYLALGDADELEDSAKGGNDKFVGGSNSGDPDTFIPFLGLGIQGDIGSGSGDYYDAVIFAGDAACMGDTTTGGNDSITGGTNSGNEFYGDALEVMFGSSKGGNDTITGGNALASGSGDWSSGDASNYIVGDAEDMYGMAKGGADSLTGGNATATDDGYAVVANGIFGDSYDAEGMTTGGADKIFGGNANLTGGDVALAFNILSGDSYYLDCGATGGGDTMQGGNMNIGGSAAYGDGYAFNVMAGDAFEMDDAIGGADTMTGGSVTDTNMWYADGYAINLMAGDAFDADDSTFGADKLTGGNAAVGTNGAVINVMYGDEGDDLFEITSFDIGSGESDLQLYANDQLFGGNGNVINVMVGDAEYLGCEDVGGNDKITAGKTVDIYLGSGDLDEFLYYFLDVEIGSGDGQNLMIGDAEYMDYGSQGGNDTLISGTGDDVMYGDAVYNNGDGGADRFVFGVSNGQDTIGDFNVEDGDKIDLTALKYNPQIRSFAGMNAVATDRIVSDGGDGTYIYLGTIYNNPSNTIHLVGVPPEELTAACFIFGV